MRNVRVIPEVKPMMNTLKLVALVRLLMVIAILSLSYCSLSRADDGFGSDTKLVDTTMPPAEAGTLINSKQSV